MKSPKVELRGAEIGALAGTEEGRRTLLQRAAEAVAESQGLTPVDQPANPEPSALPQVKAFLVKSLRSRWLCPNGHTLGMVVTEYIGKRPATRLLKFPWAFLDEDYIPETLIVSKIDAGEIGCTICGASRKWKAEAWVLEAGRK